LNSRVSMEEDRYIETSLLPTSYFQSTLIRLPIPKVERTLDRYLAALEPVVEDQEALNNTREIVKDFMSNRLMHSA